ncbi:WAS/WASL-interacting protein family member 2-like [Diorhabda sublineata]|uniref:WAS/WASL-interacting protein family member 2-like n=1 Tax=Diorhabda sublineata TaxID=1163346 RepID=UPI0024E07F5E|nr:WAS/WASL-interacting protein family member 2-like [Diorhabda sublineata]XP_056648854.1 WAS/WASL-interacting protein family member 2-like [Diorhabda sublineata]
MPAPPPPPPMASAGPPPPPPISKIPKTGKGSANERNALLKSIQQGTKLKKTVTNDRSAPMVGGASNRPSNGGTSGMRLPILPMGGLGGGLKNGNIGGGKPVSPSGGLKNFGSIQMELKKQLQASDNRNRGPPPPTPTRNVPVDSGSRQLQRENITNGFHMSQLSLNSNSNIQINQSTLHRKAKSNANLSYLDSSENSNNVQPNKPVINHGKPNVAPKPPILNGKPNSLQLKINKPISRTHSLKSPRSPSPQSPDTTSAHKFGTVRHMSSIIGQSLANSSAQNSRSRPALSTRPSAPPPSIPVHVAPSYNSSPSSHTSTPLKINMVKPNHAPPPPPPVVIPQAPSHAPPPPPPPHKSQLNKTPVPPTGSNPPSPPPRHSSMRDNNNVSRTATSLEEKFKHLFQDSNMFPPPPPYKNTIKLYNSVSVKPAPVKPVTVA